MLSLAPLRNPDCHPDVFVDVNRASRLAALAGCAISLASCAMQSPAPSAATRHPSVSSSQASAAQAATVGVRTSARSALAGSFLTDLAQVNSQRGWALAALPCPEGLCLRLAMSDDGGRSWTALAPRGLPRDWWNDVSQIRFATSRVGYLFGPALFQTDDGGRSWHRVPSLPVEALEPGLGTVIRVVYDHGGCPGPCDRTVQQASAGSDSWRTLLRLTVGGVSAQVIRVGTSVIYIPIFGNLAGGQGGVHALIFRSIDAGRTWQRLADPCIGTYQETHGAAALSAAPGGFVAVLCDSITGTAPTFIRTSADYGSSWRPPRTVPGGVQLLASPTASTLILATGGVGGSGPFTYRLLVSTDGGQRWSTAVIGGSRLSPQIPAVAFLDFENSRVGWWVSDARHIWTTSDGGLHWAPLAFP